MKTIIVNFDEELVEKIDQLQKYYSLHNRAEVIRFIIGQEYRNIKNKNILDNA